PWSQRCLLSRTALTSALNCGIVAKDHLRALLFCMYTSPPELSTLSLHDALPIFPPGAWFASHAQKPYAESSIARDTVYTYGFCRSEEHTSELQSQSNLVCRLLLEKKKKQYMGYVKRPWAAGRRQLTGRSKYLRWW